MKYLRLLFFTSLIALSGMILFACSDSGKSSKHIDQYIKSIQEKYRIKKPVEKPIVKQPVVTYVKAELRNPFHKATIPAGKRKIYPNVILRQYRLDQLRLIGTVAEANKAWGLVVAPDGMMYKIQRGMRISSNQSLVTQIGENEVKFEEDLGYGPSTEKQVVTLTIQEPAQ